MPGRLGASPDIGAFRPALADPIVAGKLLRLAERAGLAHNNDLLETIERGIAGRALIAVLLPRAPLGAVPAIQPKKPVQTPATPFAGMSATQRIARLLERTPSHLGPDLAAAFRQMVTAEALAGIAAAFAVLLAAQFLGVGEIADAALAWWAYTQAGLSGVYGLYEALRAVVAAVRAPDEAAFGQAEIRFAEGLTLVGLALLTAVVTRAARRGGGGEKVSTTAEPEAAQSKTPPRGQPARAANAAQDPATREAMARDFYQNAQWPEQRINDHLKGIDFTKDVEMTVLRKGQTVTQWVDPARGPGNYFAPPGFTPDELGIRSTGVLGQDRYLQSFTLTQDTQVLKSTAAPVVLDWDGGAPIMAKGGGTQYFAPNTAAFESAETSK